MGTRTETENTFNADGSISTRTYTVDTAPILLSKTAFNKYAAGQLGGMARFQDILDAAEASSGTVKFCSTQYESADIFEKSETDAFLHVLNNASPKIIEDAEYAAVIDAWPEA